LVGVMFNSLAPSAIERLKILDIWVDPVTKDEALCRVQTFLEKGTRPHTVFAVNPEKNFSVPRDPELYEIFRNADLLLPDGIGIVLAARILYGAKLVRVPGSDFIFDICRLAQHRKYNIFIYGASEEVNRVSSEKLCERFPGLLVVGRSNGYVEETDMPSLIKNINSLKVDILFLALGSPRQEKWFARYNGLLKTVKVCQGVGGTLDTIAGTVKRAPQVWQKLSVEWLYRLIKEPTRMHRQKILPVFVLLVFVAKLRNIIKGVRD
jgi:N-acetylglucosaminyldiphosphoundecaprenol N-acetyl-beta-D-mannosaminyltransferase